MLMETLMATSRRGPTATVADIRGDVQELRDDISRLCEQMTDIAGDTGGEAINEVKRRIQRIRDGLEDVVSNKSQGAVDAAQQIGENLTESLDQTLRTRPMTVLAVAVGIGFLFGSTWRH